MSQRLMLLLPQALAAFVLGVAAYGTMTCVGINQLRRASLVNEAYKAAAQKGGSALDQFFLGPVDRVLDGLYKPLTDTALQAQYQTEKLSTLTLDRFYQEHVAPGTWPGWLLLLGLIPAYVLLYYFFRPLFLKYTHRMVFTMALTGMLGGYYAYLTQNNSFPMGIDLAGGTELIYKLDFREVDRRIAEAQGRLKSLSDKKGEKDEDGKVIDEDRIRKARGTLESLVESKRSAPDKATEVVRKRVDPTGTKGIPITSYDEGHRIRIQLPKASPEDVERIKRAILTQGRLTFHICADDRTQQEMIQKVKAAPPNAYGEKEFGDFTLKVIETKERYDPKKIKTEDVIMLKLPMLEGSRVVFAGTARGQQGGFEIRLQFDAAGSARFEQVTAENVGKRMAIVLDGKCYSAPVIKERIGGECRISGSFTQKQADELSGVLTAGSLPAEVVKESEFNVGPSLGNEQIQSGLTATLIAAGAVSIFMWSYYRLSGFISVFCMAINLIVLMGGLGFFKATMTLPGIAGIALTLGMAVDANVLIYERIREELERGRPLRLAVLHGFDRAHLTIIDSQLTTLISGVILYYLGTGPVRGFAVTLSLGILITLFANLWVCRQFMEWLVAREAVETLKMFQFFKVTNIDFMGMKKAWMTASGALVLASLLGFIAMQNRIYDVDFTGGTLVQFNFAQGYEQSDQAVKDAIEGTLKAKLGERLTATVGKLMELSGSGKQGEELKQALREALPGFVRAQFGENAEVTPGRLGDLAAGLQKSLDELKNTDLVAQSFGQPVPGTSQYHSYTVTTRLTEPEVIEILDDELLKLFAGKVEPPAVELAGEGAAAAIRVRLNPDVKMDPQRVSELARAFLASKAAAKEFEPLKEPLAALKVSEIRKESYGEGRERAYLELAPLPDNPETRARLLDTVELLKLREREGDPDARSEGPIARRSSFGPQVSGEMGLAALLALLAALVGIFLYMWFRFEFSGGWGFGAIVALIHDSTLAIGGVCLVTATGFMPILVDLNIVAAILTIIGFSVNDTIVIFDRIREVKSAHPTRALGEIVNEAVNATLSRTIITSGTVFLATLSLFLFGGPNIRDLSFTFLVGIIVGTYSSIFIASPLMIWWYDKFGSSSLVAPAPGAREESSPTGAHI